MKYQEKIDLAKEGLIFLNEGNSIEAFKDELASKKFYKPDIDKVWRSCKGMLVDKYEAEFKSYILQEELESQRSKFQNLNNDVFDLIKSEVIERIRTDAKKEINKLIHAGLDAEEIIPKVENAVFSEQEIIDYGAAYYKDNVKISGQEKSNYQMIGIMAILVGFGLSIYTLFNPSGGKSALFIGLIVFGIIYLRKANSTRGEIERMNKN